VSIGPGTAKSRVGVFAIPWAWLRWPTLRAMCMSANPRVALRDSMYAREVISSDWYQAFRPDWTIRQDTDGKGMFANTAGGFRSAMGMDARIVGERADLLWIDDPHDPEEANSESKRSSVNDRWDTSISNRVNDLGSSIRIGIAQRCHEDDWSSRRIAEGWCELRLPLEFEPESRCVTPIGADWRTVEGECLHPARFTPEVIAAEKSHGAARWSALYQQRPTPAGGAMVRTAYLRFWRRPGALDASMTRPRGCWTGPAVELVGRFDAVVIAADLAAGKKTRDGDFNVIVAMGKRAADMFLLETWRDRADFPEVQRRFREFAERYPMARKVVEAAAAGPSLVSSLEREIPGLIAMPALGSKRERMHANLSYFEAGNVHFPEDWNGLEDAIAEVTSFPNARHDDFVDAVNLAIAELVGGSDAWMRTFESAFGSSGRR